MLKREIGSQDRGWELGENAREVDDGVCLKGRLVLRVEVGSLERMRGRWEDQVLGSLESLALYLFISLSLCLSVSLPLYLSISPSLCHPVSLSSCLSVSLSP